MNNSKNKPGIALLVFSFLIVGLICVIRIELVSMDFKWKEWDTIQNLINIHARALYLIGHAFGLFAIVIGILIFEIYQLKKKVLMIENKIKSKDISTKEFIHSSDSDLNSSDAN